MKNYFKCYYEDLKGRSLMLKVVFTLTVIGLLPVIFSVFATEAYAEGADRNHASYILALNAIILWVFIALALL